MHSNILICLYNHPEGFPPTLNAIDELAKLYKKVDILYIPYQVTNWDYPNNVNLIPLGEIINVFEFEKTNLFFKITTFIKFSLVFLKLIKLKKYHTILIYEPIGLFSYYLINRLTFNKPLLWYHNHDVTNKSFSRKYSIGWFAAKYEYKLFDKLNIFSLPTEDRKKYFRLERLKGEFFNVPNFPSLSRFNHQLNNSNKLNTVKFIYQGAISDGHGLIEIAKFIESMENVELHLAGPDRQDYIENINSIISRSKINYHGQLNYQSLPKLTSICTIGIATLIPKSVAFETAGTASNKIYEYAACGIPILYFDNEHYNSYLGKYEWALATDLSQDSLLRCFYEIINNYEQYSKAARQAFIDELNFENVFKPVANYLIKK